MFQHVRIVVVVLVVSLLAGCETVQQVAGDIGKGVSQGVDQATGGRSFGEAVASGVSDGLSGKVPQALGYVNLGNNGFVTYFDNSPLGFPSQGGLLRTPPRAGTVAPAMILVAVGRFEGKLMPNNIADMQHLGLFTPVGPVPPGASAPPRPSASAFVYKDTATGMLVSNSIGSCRLLTVNDASGKFVGRRPPARDEDYALAKRCEAARPEQ